MVLIDSSVDAAYTTATEYAVKIVGTAIDGATVNAWIGAFSIERAGGALAEIKAITAQLAGITLLNEWLGAIAGKQNADATALTEIKATGAGSGTYDPNTDSTEAVRDRGDAAWVTGGDASDGKQDTIITDIAAVQTEVDKIGTIPALDSAAQTIGAAIGKLADDNGGADFDATTDSQEKIATNIGVAGAGLGDLGGMSDGMKAEVESEANDALVALDLDHLINGSVADEVADDSIIAKMVDRSSTADWSSFVHTEDSLRAISEEVSAIGSASGGGFNFAPVGSNALEDQINDSEDAVDKSTSPETVGIPVTGHAFLAGHEVTVSGTANYDDTYVIDSVSTDEVVIVATYAAETFSSSDNIDSSIKGTTIEGVETSNTFTAVAGQDGVYHVIDDDGGDNFTIAYRYEVGADRIATEAVLTGFLNGGNDNALVQAYNFVGSAWETRKQFDGQAGSANQTVVIPLLARNTGTSGVDLGVVLLRVTDGASSSNPTLNTDSLLVEAVGTGESAGYQNGQIWLDTVNGTDGAIKHTHGTADRPCKTIANVVSLVAAGLSPDVHVLNGSSFALGSTFDNYSFFGDNWTLDLSGESIAGAHIEGAILSGTHTGTGASLARCVIGNVTTADTTHFANCVLTGTLTLVAGDIFLVQSHHGGGLVDFNSVGGATLHAHGYRGNIEFQNMATGDVVFLGGSGAVTSNANNADGTINVRGAWKVTDSGSASVVLDDITTDVNAVLVDTGSTIPGTLSTIQTSTDRLTAVRAAVLTDWIDGQRLDLLLDAVKAITDQVVFTVANQVDANTKAISDDTTAADRLEALMDGIVVAQVNDGSATTTAFAADGFTEATDDHFKGRLITFISGALSGQQTDITGYNAAGGAQGSQEFTVTALTEAAAEDDFFVIH